MRISDWSSDVCSSDLVEVVRASVRILQALVIHDETLEQVILERGGGPATALHPARRAHPVADGQDGVEAVERDRPAHLAPAAPPTPRGFLCSSFRFQHTVGTVVFQMQANVDRKTLV